MFKAGVGRRACGATRTVKRTRSSGAESNVREIEVQYSGLGESLARMRREPISRWMDQSRVSIVTPGRLSAMEQAAVFAWASVGTELTRVGRWKWQRERRKRPDCTTRRLKGGRTARVRKQQQDSRGRLAADRSAHSGAQEPWPLTGT